MNTHVFILRRLSFAYSPSLAMQYKGSISSTPLSVTWEWYLKSLLSQHFFFYKPCFSHTINYLTLSIVVLYHSKYSLCCWLTRGLSKFKIVPAITTKIKRSAFGTVFKFVRSSVILSSARVFNLSHATDMWSFIQIVIISKIFS